MGKGRIAWVVGEREYTMVPLPRRGTNGLGGPPSGVARGNPMRIAYLDCFAGITGDMALGALIHAGADTGAIMDHLQALPVEGFILEPEEVQVRGLAAIRVHVHTQPSGLIRTYASMRSVLDQADLPEAARGTAQRVYRLLAGAVAKVHAKEADLVTFHEFGEVDSLAEIVGTSLALDALGIERVFASPVPTGLGMARTEHGMVPIPSPVVMELLQGAPTYSRGIPVELVSPVGAAILAAVTEGYGDMPLMRSERVGYGAGHRRMDFPSLLRVVIGPQERTGARAHPPDAATGVLVEATLDDLEVPATERVLDRLIEAGAADVWVTPVVGRRGRARMAVSAVGPPEAASVLVEELRSAGAAAVRTSPVRLEAFSG